MSNHTPVPWKIGAYCSRPNADGMKGHRIISDGDDGFEFHIAAVGTHPGINSEAARANAVLIIEAVNNYAAMRTGIESLRLQLARARKVIDAECEQKYKLVAEKNDLLGQLASVRSATIEECARIADGWLARYGETEIKYTTAQEYACDAVEDIADGIRALARVTLSDEVGK